MITGPPPMLPTVALREAVDMLTRMPNSGLREALVIEGLEHAQRCLKDMAALLRHIREVLPDREPELHKLITSQLVKGCQL